MNQPQRRAALLGKKAAEARKEMEIVGIKMGMGTAIKALVWSVQTARWAAVGTRTGAIRMPMEEVMEMEHPQH